MHQTGRSALLIGYSVALLTLSSLLVIFRLVSRRLAGAKILWDDVLIIISLLGSFPFYAGVMLMVHYGMGRHIKNVSYVQLENLLKIIYAGNFPYLVIVSMTKTSILLYYLRLFGTPGIRPGFRKLLYATQAIVIIWFIGSLVPGTFRCHPIDDFWNPLVVGGPNVSHYCTNNNTYYLASSAFNVALDFWILVLPLSIVWTLQLSARRKAGLSAIFLLGGFICCASIARAYTVSHVSPSDFSYESSPSIIWSSVEVSLGIICACLPTIQPVLLLFRRRVRDTTPRMRRRRDNSGFWYSESVTRESRQTEGRNRDRTYGRLDEELATLPLAYSSNDPTLERYRMSNGAEEIEGRKDMPATTIRGER